MFPVDGIMKGEIPLQDTINGLRVHPSRVRFLSLFYFFPSSPFMAGMSYFWVAVIVAFLIIDILVTFIRYRRFEKNPPGKKMAIGDREARTILTSEYRDEASDVTGILFTYPLFIGLVAVIGFLTGSLLLLAGPVVLAAIACFALRGHLGKDKPLTVKAAYLVNIAFIACIAIPAGVDAYAVFVTQNRVVTRYQDASNNYHASEQRNALVGQVHETHSGDGATKYQWGELSPYGANIIVPMAEDGSDSRRRVDIVEDLSSSESPYVVHEVTVERFIGVGDDAQLCTARNISSKNDCGSKWFNAREQGAVITIHVPTGERDKYITVSN